MIKITRQNKFSMKLHLHSKLLLIFLLFATNIRAQQIELTGTIKDERNQELIGATVRVKGTLNGAATDASGKFRLNIKQKLPVTLVASYIGYFNQTIVVYENEPLAFKLNEDVNRLSEVVVVSTGYTTQTKKEYTGSFAQVNTKQLESRPAQSFDQLIGGQAAGVDIVSTSGELNNPAVIRIRGINSITSGIYPLVVVDGVPIFTGNVGGNISQNPLSDINPNDIESIDILKDAAATAIYGSRAANGVLVITTKKGKKGKTKINYNNWVNYVTPYNFPAELGAKEYVDIKNEALANKGLSPGFVLQTNTDGSYVDTKWSDLAYRNAFSQNHDLSVSGANDNTTYYLSANYSNQNGIIVHNNFERKSIRFNLDQKIVKNVTAGINFTYSNSINKSHAVSGQNSGGLNTPAINRQTYTLPPNISPYNADGSYNINLSNGNIGFGPNSATILGSINSHNLLAQLDLDRVSSNSNNNIGNIYAEWAIITGLKLKTSYGFNRLAVDNSTFYNPFSGSAFGSGSITNASDVSYRTDWTNTLSYSRSFNKKHNFDTTIGHEEIYTKSEGWGATRSGLSDPFFNVFQGGYSTIVPANNSLSETGFISYFGSINYNFDKKYLLSYSYRRDGYSGLPSANRWGNFNGASVGWTISEEKFFKNSVLAKLISDLKFSASYGEVGNINIGAYPALALYEPGTNAGTGTLGFSQAANQDLQWETSKKTNVGFKAAFLSNRISLGVDYYDNNIDGLIINVPTTPSLGIPGNSISANAGSLYNKGIEFSVNGAIIRKKGFSWNSVLNLSFSENKVTKLASDYYTPSTFGIMNMTRQGYAVGSIFAVPTNGVDPANGNRIFVNAKGEEVEYNAVTAKWIYKDGTSAKAIDNYADGKIQGSSLPTYYGGFTNTIDYKGFDLQVGITFSGGNKIYNATKATLTDGRYFNNSPIIKNRWTAPGQITDIPKVVWGDNVSNGFTISNSYYSEDGDYIKLKNIVLGYKFDLSKITNNNLTSVRVYGQATNLLTITKYEGSDPEISNYGNSINSGFDRNSVVNSRTFSVGLNVAF
jgi:TonB-linked SusC/RagA family outer membrane protein